tara:strand:+ start:116 stop:2146 length:2031 start_codon:yes stop_codon:yes gene_type:complete
MQKLRLINPGAFNSLILQLDIIIIKTKMVHEFYLLHNLKNLMRLHIFTLGLYLIFLNASSINAQQLPDLTEEDTEFVNEMIEAIPSHYLADNYEKRHLVAAKKEFANNGIILNAKILKKYLDFCLLGQGQAIKFYRNEPGGIIQSCNLRESEYATSLVEIKTKLNNIDIDLFDESDFSNLYRAYKTVLYNTDKKHHHNFFRFIDEYADASKIYNYKKFELSEILKTSIHLYQNQEIVNALPGFDYASWNRYSGENRYWIIEYVDFYFQNVDGISKSEYFDLAASLASTDKAIRKADERKELYEKLERLKENKDRLLRNKVEEITACQKPINYIINELKADIRQESAKERRMGYPSTGSDSLRDSLNKYRDQLLLCGTMPNYDDEIERLEEKLEWISNKDFGEPSSEILYQKGNIKNEEFDGPLISYRSDRSVKEKVNYKEGKKNGNHEIFDEYDDTVFIKKSTSYKDDLRHGLYFENCKCYSKDKWCLENENKFEKTGYYKDGLKDGEFIKINCRKKERPQTKLETYKNGRRHGKVLTSFASFGSDISDFLIGQGVSNYNSKKIRISSTAIGRVNKVLENYKDGLREGEFIQYYDNGQPFLTAVFKNGIENGPFKLYKPNGDLLVERNCVNRKLDSVVGSTRILGERNEGSPMPFGEFCEFYWNYELRKLANYTVL